MFLQMLDKVLQVFAYPFEKSDLDEENPPVRVCLRLPDTVVFFKTPKVARWDAAGRAESDVLWFRLSPAGEGNRRHTRLNIEALHQTVPQRRIYLINQDGLSGPT